MPQLAIDSKGVLYGSMIEGDVYTICARTEPACGWIFLLTPHGTRYYYRKLYQFLGGNDGMSPNGGLVAAAGGVIYGTTLYGGTMSCFPKLGCGTIFALAPSAGGYSKKMLHVFAGPDGAKPAHLTMLAGALYGTTFSGGGTNALCPQPANNEYPGGCGTFFKLTP